MKGLRVLDLSEDVAGAYCTRLLATSGAEVLVAEPAHGSALRSAPPLVAHPTDADRGTISAAWEYFQSYKRGTTVRSEAEIVSLAADHDVIVLSQDVAGSNTDGLERLHRLSGRLRAEVPTAVIVAISSFGLTGPYRNWKLDPLGHWAIGGHLLLTGERDREPIPGGGPWASCLVGATAAIAAQAAAFEARRTGQGALVDIGAMEALASSHQWSFTLFTHNGLVKRRWGNRLGEQHHPISMYPCTDGWVAMACAGRHQWEGLCIAMDRVELLADEDLYIPAVRFDRADELDVIIGEWCSTRTVAQAVEVLQGNNAPAARVNEFHALLSSDQLEHRSYWVPDEELASAELGPNARMPAEPFVVAGRIPFRPAPRPGSSDVAADQVPAANVPRDSGSPPPETSQPFAPLAGIRVLEFSIAWAGPLAGRFLADLGAEVIKIEHPTARGLSVSDPGDVAQLVADWEWGTMPPAALRNGTYPGSDPGEAWWNRIGYWNKMNRGKRSLCLDVKAPRGRELFERLVAQSDVVLNNYSPRGVRSLGLDCERLRAVNPKLITVDMSGFGATGPGAQQVSFGPVLDATSGLAGATGYSDSGPYKQGIAFPDAVGGLHGAIAVLSAIWERARTDQPVHVDLSQLETLLAVAGDSLLESSLTGRSPQRRGARSSVAAPAGVYACAGDDEWVAMTIADDEQWRRLCDEVGPDLDRPEWAHEPHRRADHDAIDRIITAWTLARTKMDVMAVLQARGVAAAPLLTNRELVEDPHLAARHFMVPLEHPDADPLLFPGTPLHFDTGSIELRPAPGLGADNADLLAELGYTTDEIAALTETTTVATRPPS